MLTVWLITRASHYQEGSGSAYVLPIFLEIENLARHHLGMDRRIQLAAAGVVILAVLVIFVHPATVGPPARYSDQTSILQLILLWTFAGSVVLLLLVSMSFSSSLAAQMGMMSEPSDRLAFICTLRC